MNKYCQELEIKWQKKREHQKKQVRAIRKIREKIKAGKMIRESCIICGLSKTEGHHDDYDKPLEVEWLCMTHHRALHKILREDQKCQNAITGLS